MLFLFQYFILFDDPSEESEIKTTSSIIFVNDYKRESVSLYDVTYDKFGVLPGDKLYFENAILCESMPLLAIVRKIEGSVVKRFWRFN